MNRTAFHKLFKSAGPVVLPVIHVLDAHQSARNIDIAISQSSAGVLLINHDFPMPDLLLVLHEIRAAYPLLWLGVNFLGISGKDAFPVLAELARENIEIDAYWADNALIDERSAQQLEAEEIAKIRAECAWQGLYFGGVAFKKQREVAPQDYPQAAACASAYMDVVTTSGVATGQAASIDKIVAMRKGSGDTALALASGITPENAASYCKDVDCFLVATGINRSGDFYNIDPPKLRRLLAVTRHHARSEIQTGKNYSDERAYLCKMAPNIRGPKFAWLDPSSLYINAEVFHALLDDLSKPFLDTKIDVVAGIDAMGFVLGAALAERLGKGFLAVRKAGKIPLDTDSVEFTNYSGKTQSMELRLPAFAAGTRVLLVDQWIETGGTMNAAIALVERQSGQVCGIAAVCIEENAATRRLRDQYLCSTAVTPGSEFQRQCNQQTLDSFADFKPELVFPEI